MLRLRGHRDALGRSLQGEQSYQELFVAGNSFLHFGKDVMALVGAYDPCSRRAGNVVEKTLDDFELHAEPLQVGGIGSAEIMERPCGYTGKSVEFCFGSAPTIVSWWKLSQKLQHEGRGRQAVFALILGNSCRKDYRAVVDPALLKLCDLSSALAGEDQGSHDETKSVKCPRGVPYADQLVVSEHAFAGSVPAGRFEPGARGMFEITGHAPVEE